MIIRDLFKEEAKGKSMTIKGLYEPTHSCFRNEITRKCEQ